MGSSIDAYVAFGWIMPEHACEWQPGHEACERKLWSEDDPSDYYWECKIEDEAESFYLPDHTDLLDNGFDGSGYAGENATIIYLKASEIWASWGAVVMELPEFEDQDPEAKMRAELESFGVKPPTDPARWILWPHYG